MGFRTWGLASHEKRSCLCPSVFQTTCNKQLQSQSHSLEIYSVSTRIHTSVNLYIAGCGWTRLSWFSKAVWTWAIKSPVQQAQIFHLHSTWNLYLSCSFLHPLWCILWCCWRRWKAYYWLPDFCRHHCNLFDHSSQCSGKKEILRLIIVFGYHLIFETPYSSHRRLCYFSVYLFSFFPF